MKAAPRKDLLSFLLTAKNPNVGLPLGGDEVLAGASSFIVGDSDTTSSTMAFVDFVSRDQSCKATSTKNFGQDFLDHWKTIDLLQMRLQVDQLC